MYSQTAKFGKKKKVALSDRKYVFKRHFPSVVQTHDCLKVQNNNLHNE